MKIIDRFRSSTANSKMDEKLFDELLIIIALVSFVNIIGNLIISFPFQANYKWALLIVLSFIVNHYKTQSSWIKFYFVLFITSIILPLGWYQSGAGNNNVIAYIFLTVIAITFIFKGKQRMFLITFISLLFISFIIIELNNPNFLPLYDRTMQLTDRLIQIPLALFVTFIMLRQFDSSYRENSQKLKTLNHELEVFAYTDSLTGIHNRAFIFQKFNEAIDNNLDFLTVIIDIDNFKLINDNYGHLAGDNAIRYFANLLSQQFSPYGYVARYGGDEFIMLLSLDPQVFLNKIHEFTDIFKEHELTIKFNATYSAGYGLYNKEALDIHLKKVDKALYKAKNSGRDKIVSI